MTKFGARRAPQGDTSHRAKSAVPITDAASNFRMFACYVGHTDSGVYLCRAGADLKTACRMGDSDRPSLGGLHLSRSLLTNGYRVPHRSGTLAGPSSPQFLFGHEPILEGVPLFTATSQV